MIEQREEPMLDLSVSIPEATPTTGKQIISALKQQGFEVYNARRRKLGLLGMKFLATVRITGDATAALAVVQLVLPTARINAEPFSI